MVASPSRIFAAATAVALVTGATLAAPEAGHAAQGPTPPTPDRLSSIPDPVPSTGTWQRTGPDAWSVATAPDDNALALSAQQVDEVGWVGADVTVDPGSPLGVGALVVRAAADGSAGYALTLDPHLDRVRLFDLADGSDVAVASVESAPGETRTLELAVDGTHLRATVDGAPVIDVVDGRYGSGSVGLHAYNGTVAFTEVGARVLDSDLTGWEGEGGWTVTSSGLTAVAGESGATALSGTTSAGTALAGTALAETVAVDADVSVRLLPAPGTSAGLVLRASDPTTGGIEVLADTGSGQVEVRRRSDGAVLGASSAEQVAPSTVHVLRAVLDGPQLEVYWQEDVLTPAGRAPVLVVDVGPGDLGAARAGVTVARGSATFTSVSAAGTEQVPAGWATTAGTWSRDRDGSRAVVVGTDGHAVQVSPRVGADVVAITDLAVPGGASADLVLRASADGSGGTAVRLTAGAGTLEVVDRSDGTTLATVGTQRGDLVAGTVHRLEAHVVGSTLRLWLDGVSLDVSGVPVGPGAGDRVALTATSGVRVASLRADAADEHLAEAWRPAYHYSRLTGGTSDPNGLVYLDGEWHLFHQSSGEWAHAVSTDLVSWRQLPIALPSTAEGDSWSGSAVVDHDDSSGLFDGGSGLVAFPTSFDPSRPGGNQHVRAAYSSDQGRSWRWVDGAVVENPGGPDGDWDFRDPKVVRDEENDQWVMVVSGGDHLRFFTSTNLLDWEHTSSFGYGDWVSGGVLECPDLFPLPVDGNPDDVRWVLAWSTGAVRETDGSTAQYVTGTWDGTTFTSDTSSDEVLRPDGGRDFYAAMSFSDAPDGRRVWLGWTSSWDYPFSAPTGAWNGQLSVPREVSLVSRDGGYRLAQAPVAEVDALRAPATTVGPVAVTPGGPDPLAGITGTAYDAELSVALPAEVAGSTSSGEVEIALRTGGEERTVLLYDRAAQTLSVDRSASGGSDLTEHFASGGSVVVPLEDVDGVPTLRFRVLVDSSSIEVFADGGRAVLTDLVLPDPSSDGLSLAVRGTDAVVTAVVHPMPSVLRPAGTSGTLPVPQSPGEARSDLGALEVRPGGRWTDGGEGVSGHFDLDSHALSEVTAADVAVSATLRFGGSGVTSGAGAVILRASADGADGYYVNIDPNLDVARVMVRSGGGFAEDAVVASAPVLLSPGVGYDIVAAASGSTVSLTVDGVEVLSVEDSRYASGAVGLNVFGGRASFQDVAVGP